MENKEYIIEIEHLSKSFDDRTVLDNIDLRVRSGEFVTLLGPSGCGKTTLLKMLAGFLEPDEGTIMMDGKDISGTPPNHRPLNTVFQHYALFPHLDVYDNVAFGLKLKGLPEKEIDERVRKVLKIVSMSDYEDRAVDSLSGGQQQRVSIARAIINRPKVLLLDEPLSALDLKMRKDMQIELKEMHKKLGITFIYVTHDQEEALTLSDTIVVMNEGRIQQIGSPADIYNEPVNSFVADFIGESNIFNATMLGDRRVSFIGHEFECVDEGFGENVPVDVVIRPEDVYIMNQETGAQFMGKVTSCTFKGVHYEMLVNTREGYEIMIQDYNAFEVGSEVGMIIRPNDIQVMKKDFVINQFEGEMTDSSHVNLMGEDFECAETGFEAGTKVIVEIPFDRVELTDEQSDGTLYGEVHVLLYKGDHYHLTVRTEEGFDIFVDTNDIWDKGDLVGINFPVSELIVRKKNESI